MKINPPLSVFGARLTKKLRNKISKEFRNKIIVDKAKEDINSIIVLGNGNVDDLVVPVVCYHLNGNRTVGITKPDGKKGISVLNGFPQYISGTKIDKIALVMDQEGEDLDGIFEGAERNLRNQNIQFNKIENISRFKLYRCKIGSRTFDFILIINGLDDIPAETHNVEDHLVKAALELSKITHSDIHDSKETWNSIDTHLQREILNSLVKNRSISSEVFPQHFDGLRLLEE